MLPMRPGQQTKQQKRRIWISEKRFGHALTSSGAIEFSEVLACQKFSAGEWRYEVWLPAVTKPAELRSFMTYDFPADFHGRSSM